MGTRSTPAWVGWSYLSYLILWVGFTIGGASYVVFWRGESGWWILAAVALCALGYQPQRWRQLWTD